MWPLGVLLLWALVCAARGNVQEEIFTRLGSDLLLPIRRNLTLNRKDGACDEFEWKYKDPSSRHTGIRIARHRGCNLATDNRHITNTRILEDGSLIIDDVTLDNEGIYRVEIHSFRGDIIQRGYYIIHVEVPLSGIEVTSSCFPDGSAKAECSVNGSDPRYSWTMNGRSVSNESWVTLPPPASGTLRCDVTNQINKTSKSISINCPGTRSHWGHLLSPGVVCVLYTALLICMLNDLRKMKNERNRSDRRTRRRDQTDMEMETTYYNERN